MTSTPFIPGNSNILRRSYARLLGLRTAGPPAPWIPIVCVCVLRNIPSDRHPIRGPLSPSQPVVQHGQSVFRSIVSLHFISTAVLG